MSFHMPAEWDPHERMWIGFPWDEREWPDNIAAAQDEIAAFANAVYNDGAGTPVTIVTGNKTAADRARRICNDNISIELCPVGDIWLRDTGCIIVTDGARRRARNFRFNGWGEKYLMDGDQDIGRHLAQKAGLPITDCNWILEGGAIDVDGSGLAATTEQCLLNPNRKSGMAKAEIKSSLKRDLGINRLLWLGNGLTGDHTDGHVDNLARFVAPGHLLIPKAQNSDDPNIEIYEDAMARARDFGVKVSTVPSPGRVTIDGDIAAASYLNFVMTNNAVFIPSFDRPNDKAAMTAFSKIFVGRQVTMLPSKEILRGGGSLHCCSQQLIVAKNM